MNKNQLMLIGVNVYDICIIDITKDSATVSIGMLNIWMSRTNKIAGVLNLGCDGTIIAHAHD